MPAAAWVHGGDQLKARRVADAVVDARDDRLSALDGLAKRIQDMRREFRKFVEEEHAVMSERHFSARLGAGAPANERSHACRVMRRTEGALGRQSAVDDRARNALDHRDFQQFPRLERRQNAWEPLGEHRFACTRRPGYEHVVAD